ncbi:hypothetical protein L6452_16255 [Arctium lappa]|uniref:Uncharacterized protein n=1 Tax=Arctium lappa TaxID=4217 RepID=A0ACB9C011_ARCLA|nr:hypothetical protein L6452_16255 [Arctium lappa]
MFLLSKKNNIWGLNNKLLFLSLSIKPLLSLSSFLFLLHFFSVSSVTDTFLQESCKFPVIFRRFAPPFYGATVI